MSRLLCRILVVFGSLAANVGQCTTPEHVDITWMSIANMHFDLGSQHILVDGYISRLPQDIFYGGGGGFASTRRAMTPDIAAVREVFDAIGGKSAVKLLLAGHSHWDHTFDTATWAKLSGARVIGSPTTCLQTRAAGIPATQCKPVHGGERIRLAPGIDMYVIRWNHSGDSAANPEQHDPVELHSIPVPAVDGALHAGVTEDFPNGGGTLAYLFKVTGSKGSFSWLFQDSASAVDLRQPIIVDGRNYGAPLDNLAAAMKSAGLDSVNLWISTGGEAVAALVLPVLKPKACLPVHWDGLFGAFKAGPAQPFSDSALASLLKKNGVELVVPRQYMDRWRLDGNGIHELDTATLKRAVGLP
ncbi:MAG: hypothetical protein ABI616_08200 [Pseudomonadota bacterium]